MLKSNTSNKRLMLSILALLSTVVMFVGFVVSATDREYDVNVSMTEPEQQIYLEPAGYAFVIWLFIYMGYVLFGIYQLWFVKRLGEKYYKAAPYVILNSLCNVGWFYAVRIDSYLLQVVFILGMLLTLIAINTYLDLADLTGRSIWNLRLVVFPISIYLGWITAATPINVAFWLARDYGITDLLLGPIVWSILLVIVSTILFGFLFFKRLINPYTLGAGIWALIAIGLANLASTYPIGIAAFTGVGCLLSLLIIRYRSMRYLHTEKINS